MNILSTLFRWQEQPVSQYPGIDLGNGHSLTAEEVLEGHFYRLSGTQKPLAEQSNITPVHPVTQPERESTEDENIISLGPAITRLAPDLAPLTDLAEEIEEAVPHVQLEPKFRHDLHKALELAHRQQAAQRTLGTHSVSSRKGPLTWQILSFTTFTVMVLVLLSNFFRYQRNQKKDRKN